MLIHGPALGATAAAAAEANGNGPAAAAVVKIHMAGDDDEANEKARRERELQEKRAQNALPSWIAQSTISADPEQRDAGGGAAAGEVPRSEDRNEVPANGHMSSSAAAGGATLRMDDEMKPSVHEKADGAEQGEDASLDAYYASLAALEEGTPGVDSTSSLGGTPAVSASAVDSPSLSFGATPARADSEQVEPPAMADLSADVSAASSAKRSREASAGEDLGEANKRARTAASGSPSNEPADVSPENENERLPDARIDDLTALATQHAAEGGDEAEDEDDFDEFEAADEGDADPNQLVMVAGKELPFSEVTDDMTGEMVRPCGEPSDIRLLTIRHGTDGRRVQRELGLNAARSAKMLTFRRLFAGILGCISAGQRLRRRRRRDARIEVGRIFLMLLSSPACSSPATAK